jgi:multidrug resistance efflux pump
VLTRAREAQKEFPKSITETEYEKLRLENERDGLSYEKAMRDELVADLQEELKGSSAELAKLLVNRRTIVSPIDGILVEVPVQVGGWAASGATVARVIGLDRLRIVAQVPSGKIDDSQVGQPVRFTAKVPYSDAPVSFEGKITFVSPEVSINDDLRVWAEIENTMHQLRPGVRGELEITLK